MIDLAGGHVIGIFKAASADDEYRDSYAIATNVLRDAWPDVVKVLPRNPYQSLEAFTEDDADLFLGRDAEINRLVEVVRRSPLVLVIGPSGVGKSSLVQAGLIPALDADGWACEVCRPSDHPDDPFQALAAALRRAEGATGADIDLQRARAAEIRDGGLTGLAAALRAGSGRRTLLVVDQMEELFHVEDGRVVAGFLERLLELPGTMRREQPVAVVATLRADFYHRLLDHPDAAPRLTGREVMLSPLGAAALREVIEQPARRSGGVTFEDHLVDRIVVDATTGAGALPLLEFALTTLWDRQSGGRIGHTAYGEIGAVTGSLDQHGEDTAEELLDDGISDRDIERTLIALVSSSSREDIPATRRTCPAGDLDAIQLRVA
ncbi:MAG: AAA family ATPase, partial [Nocardioidaceae bacterium]